MSQRALNVLIADDEPMVRDFVSEALKQLGHNAVFVESGEAARAELSAKTYHLVISDFIMPKLDGYELLSWMRTRGNAAYFVLISGYYNQSIEKAFKESGADEIVAKPFKMETLQRIIANYERKVSQAAAVALSPAPVAASAVAAAFAAVAGQAPQMQAPDAAETPDTASALAMLAAEIPGFASASVVEIRTLKPVAKLVKDPNAEPEAMTVYNRDLFELKRQNLDAMGLTHEHIADIITTTESYIHFVKFVDEGKCLFYLIAQKKYTNLGIVRHIVAKYAGALAP